MRSKSARWLSRASVSLALALAPTGAAWATLTITPQNFSRKTGETAATIYYASTTTAGDNAFDDATANAPFLNPDPAYGVVDIRQVQGASIDYALSFKVVSTATITPPDATHVPMLAISVSGTSSATHYVPIATYNEFSCSVSANCRPVVGGNLPGAGTYFYAVPFTGSEVSIRIFPKDICNAYNIQQGAGTAGGCNTTTITDILAADPANSVVGGTFSLTWQIIFVDPAGVISGTAADTGTLNLLFQSSASSWTCPSSSALAERYFPGDAEIDFDATPIGRSSSTGFAPQTGLIAISKLYSGGTEVAPVRTSSFSSENDTINLISFGDHEKIRPLQNTTNGSDNKYAVAFMMTDAAGIINPVASGGDSGVCKVGPIQSASIQTFLNQSKCFIATAAFRSVDAAPVQMLRQFRDEILLSTRLGSAFVDWYYDWSPHAAEWLMEHPQVRAPVLRALVPVQIGAWILLVVHAQFRDMESALK